MNEQPGDLLDEAVKLFETLRRRVGETGGGRGREAGPGGADDDVWSRAVADADPAAGEARPPRIATGAPECLDCPVCRAIAVARESGTEVRAHVRQAGRSLLAAALDVAAAYERTRDARPPGPPPHGPRRARPPEGAGGEDPIDIG
ncbi:hypothetical protein [Actinomadura viridis]|uniref:Uncharacterized protein n=1 Tax=Actinomadura viridis TaxID=58110 RepID=A0A931DDT9_9ACTN|nr:hypothetical protein [Actinomadura viridis]MBG6088270.1 hypothetical protein [Actinomadura viridis]